MTHRVLQRSLHIQTPGRREIRYRLDAYLNCYSQVRDQGTLWMVQRRRSSCRITYRVVARYRYQITSDVLTFRLRKKEARRRNLLTDCGTPRDAGIEESGLRLLALLSNSSKFPKFLTWRIKRVGSVLGSEMILSYIIIRAYYAVLWTLRHQAPFLRIWLTLTSHHNELSCQLAHHPTAFPWSSG
jgi:hypothetical protein